MDSETCSTGRSVPEVVRGKCWLTVLTAQLFVLKVLALYISWGKLWVKPRKRITLLGQVYLWDPPKALLGEEPDPEELQSAVRPVSVLLHLEDLGGPQPLSLSHISGLLFPEVAQHGNKFSFLSAVKFNCFVFKKVINLKLFLQCSHHMNMNKAFHGVLTYKLWLPIWMATTGARILFTDWSHLWESNFTDSGWSSDICLLVWNSLVLFEATWQNWFNVLTDVTVIEIR